MAGVTLCAFGTLLHTLRMETETMQTIYEAAGGFDGILSLAHAWHTRVLEDEVVSHAFSHGFHPQHTERLAAYWAEALGGPTMYSDQYGDETSVVRIHSGNGLHEEMDQRAIACFDQALHDAGLVDNDDHDGALSPLSRRGACRFAHPKVVLERTRRECRLTSPLHAAEAA